MKSPIAAVGLIEAARTLWNVKKVRDYREKLARKISGDEKVGRKLADEMLSELFSDNDRLHKNIKHVIQILHEHRHQLNTIDARVNIIKSRLERRGLGGILKGKTDE